MSLSAIIRNSASRLVRAGRRNFLFPLSAPLVKPSENLSRCGVRFVITNLSNYNWYSAAADANNPSSSESLLKVIDSEIQVAEESECDRVEEVPEGYPFKIHDSAGQQTIMLTREYEGEDVKVEVYMPDLVTGEDNEIDDDNDEDNTAERPTQSNIPLVVTVSKKSGTSLEFSCVAYADRIAIESLSVRNPETPEEHMAYAGPNFHDLDEKLKKAFHKYLEFRGVTPSTTNFLHEYMINKDSREYLEWLKNLKTFVEA